MACAGRPDGSRGRRKRDGGRGMRWLGLAGLRYVDPANDVTVGVGLNRLEDKLARTTGQRVAGDREVLELPRLHVPARPGDLRDRRGKRAVIGSHWLGQLDDLHRRGPAGNWLGE